MQKKYSEIKPGEVFTFGGQSWICVMEDILEERAFDEESNNWGKSEVRKYLNDEFYKKLIKDGADEEDFLSVKTDLIADDGTNEYAACYDYISLMTADLYRRNRYLLKLLEELGKLANGINEERHEQIIDSIGDVYVGLIVLSMQLDLDFEKITTAMPLVLDSEVGGENSRNCPS